MYHYFTTYFIMRLQFLHFPLDVFIAYSSIYFPSKGTTIKLEERDIKARMDTPVVRAVLDMRFDRNIVQQAVRKRLEGGGLI